MPAAPWPDPTRDRLLVVDRDGWRHHAVPDLPDLLAPGDLVVLNDAATLPASIPAWFGGPVELRLAEWRPDGDPLAVVFGAGSWRDDTDLRPPPPTLRPGDRVAVAEGAVEVLEVVHPRLVRVRLPARGDALLAWLYRHARPVQYSYVAGAVPLGLVQTRFAGRPWAVEMPSAGRPLTWATLARLRARGIGLATLTHGAGLSASGDPSLDALLPLPERYDLPERTVAAIRRTKASGGRVVAIGTTVVRALEDAARRGLRAGEAVAALVLDADTERLVVDDLVTNMHGPGESHFRLATAFAPADRLAAAHLAAIDAGYRAHEFGDVALVRG